MNKPGSLIKHFSGKEIRSLLDKKGIVNLFADILASLNSRWQLRSAQQLGPRGRVWGRLHIQNFGNMTIGSHVRLRSRIVPIDILTGQDGLLKIGDDVFINFGCSITALQHVQIGSSCSLGPYVLIMDNNFHHMEPELRNVMPDSSPVILEENVWLGARVIVLPGVTIGRDSVIGAGSVVTKNIPARSVAVGVPARIIKSI
jgi:acetyltransferase-like isoleucine patch superfamily enzyme